QHLRGHRAERAGRAGDDRGLAAHVEQGERVLEEVFGHRRTSTLGHCACAPSPRSCIRNRVYPISALFAGLSRIYPSSAERVGVRGLCTSAKQRLAERPPHPDPLPLKGEREKEKVTSAAPTSRPGWCRRRCRG